MIKKSTHLEEVTKLYKELNSSEKVAVELSEKYNIPNTGSLSRKIRKWMNELELTKSFQAEVEDAEIFKKASKRKHKESTYHIITSAQNATNIHVKFWDNIQAYAEYLGAEIEVIPIRYKNPTSTFSEKGSDWWDSRLHDNLIATRFNLNKRLCVAADVKMQPTASMPLSGMEGLTKGDSCILGHPRQHFTTIPSMNPEDAKFLMSTGSVTLENYTDSKAGKKGEFHHTFGFVIVEIVDDEVFFIRQVSANKDGSFYDFNLRVSDKEVTKIDKVQGMILGDLHLGHHCDYALEQTFQMIDLFKPKHIALHDIMDGSCISHHEKKDPFIALKREQDGSWDLESEIGMVVDFLETLPSDSKIVIVKSNHDEFIDRWLLDNDWRKEKNKYAYLKYSKLKADGELPNGILPYNVALKFGERVKCLTEDESYKVADVELGVHGHVGNAGSRGSAIQFKRLNTKLVTAHTHSPLKLDNLVTVGTLTKLRVGYNRGLSSWYNGNAIIHPNGKVQNILIVKGVGYSTLI